MAVYSAPADTRWGDMGRGINQGLMIGMQNQRYDDRMNKANQYRRDDMDYRATLKQTQLDKERKYKEGMLNKMFGYMPSGAVGDDMFVQGQVTPQGTGLTPQMLEMMKIQAQTGINPMSYIPKDKASQYTSVNPEHNLYRDGVQIQTGVKNPNAKVQSSFGKWATDMKLPMNMETFKQYKTTGQKPDTKPTKEDKRTVQLQKDIRGISNKIASVTAGENIYSSATTGRDDSLKLLKKQLDRVTLELKTYSPDAYNKMFRTVVKTGVDNNGRKVVKYSDGTIDYAE